METLTYQHQPENWLYEITQKGNSQTCYVMVENVKVRIANYYCLLIMPDDDFFLFLHNAI